MALISEIKLHQNNDGRYRVRIRHDGKFVESCWHRNAADAYARAESKLVYKPGYVMAVPIEER